MVQLQFGFSLREACGGHLPPHARPRARVPALEHPRSWHTERPAYKQYGEGCFTEQSNMLGAAERPCCKHGAAEKRSRTRLSCSASCFHSCGRCGAVAFPPSQKPGSVSVVLKRRRCVLAWRIHEPWLLPHDIWNDVISFFRKSIRSFVSLTAQGKQIGLVLLLTTLSHVVAGGLLNVRTSLM